jgi:cysteine desulfurase
VKTIYLDNGATTIVPPEVLREMLPYFDKKYGNASTIYTMGSQASDAIERSRETIAKKLNADPSEIYFTSGGTESNNLEVKGTAFANLKKGKHVIASRIEHDCVLESCRWLEEQGWDVTYLPVDKYGLVSPPDVQRAIRKDTVLVSVMHANNEIGTIEPIEEIGKICREKEVYFHTDACQSFTKVPLDVKKHSVDMITINAHKIHGPKGVGALYVRKGTKLEPWQSGGGHERGMRSGTENVPGIVGFAKAVTLVKPSDIARMRKLRDQVIKEALSISGTVLNGHPERRLCNNANFIFKGIDGEALVLSLDRYGIETSTGSACSSHSQTAGHVLRSIGIPPERTHGSLRVTLSKYTTPSEIILFRRKLRECVLKLRRISPLA